MKGRPRNRAILKRKQSKVVMIREKLEQWLNMQQTYDADDQISEMDSVLERVLQTRTRRRVAHYLRRHWQMKEKINDYLDVLMFGTEKKL